MSSESSELSHRRPLLSRLCRGRRCCRPAHRCARHISAPFASISATSQAKDRTNASNKIASASKDTHDSSVTQTASSDEGAGAERFTSLVQLESEPLVTVIFPQWMVEAYQELVMFGSACKRLFLPENSIKSKLPYYRCALP